MKNSDFKRKILEKYGTITRFCHLTGLSYQKVSLDLSKEDTAIQSILEPIIDRTPFNKIEGLEVTDKLIQKVRNKIASTGLAPTLWARSNGISPNTISLLLNGKLVYKSRRVNDVCNRLGVK